MTSVEFGERARRCQKLRVPRWCLNCSSRPVARFRPLLTCFRAALAGCATRDLAWAPGLPPTGKTVQRLGTQLAFDGCSCSPQPALSCRPLLALPELILRCFLGDLAWAPDAAPTG